MLIKKIDCRLAVTFSLILSSLFGLHALANKPSKLDKVHQDIVKEYSNVSHVETVSEIKADEPNLILIDVRELDEFEVSHIEGAIRVSPDITTSEFLNQFSSNVEGKTYLFYCSVGQRSSELIDRVQEGLLSEGATLVSNLEGGVFKWHNEHKALINQHGDTDLVHPYNFWWKRLLSRPKESSYSPN